MAGTSNLGFRAGRTSTPVFLLSVLVLFLAAAGAKVQAAIQFDVFLGYDGIVPEASWFPVVCEIKNDGPTFNGTVELSGGYYNEGQSVRTTVELPTGTLKRLVIPVFCSSRMNSSWDLRLVDERGRMRAEQPGVRPRRQASRGTPLIGALSRTAGGAPALRQTQSTELQPMAARLLPSIFPDNPLVLEALSCIYLSSERAYDLSQTQVNALLAWLNAGGHLVIGVEQPSEVTALGWLRGLYPCDLRDLKTITRHPELNDWIRSTSYKPVVEDTSAAQQAANAQSQFRRRYGVRGGPPVVVPPTIQPQEVTDFFSKLPIDFDFESAPMQVAVGQVREGTVEVSADGIPLMVSTQRGRGRVTALLFSPEREPVRSWKNLDMFWAKLADVPGVLFVSKDLRPQGGYSSDGIFGAMIDTRQVHKLPVFWLLMLLLVYLVVIGPFDQWWLKRIGKPMLTWITFPCYVVAFSLVIYLIGYKLRAGESEWNELYVVDVLQKEDGADLRGRTYSSVYSPSNQRYTLEGQQRYATLRSEFAGLWGQNQSERSTVVQSGDSFKAEIFVPVWTSELYVSDWWQPANTPVSATIKPNAQGWDVQIDNHTDHKLSQVQLVLEQRVRNLGELKPNESRTVSVLRDQGTPLSSFVSTHASGFESVVTSRQRALGASESGQLSDLPNASMAVSFLGQVYRGSFANNYARNFISPPGLDLTDLVDHGNAVVLAWSPDYAPIRPMYQFTPKRSQKYTLWRVAVQPSSRPEI